MANYSELIATINDQIKANGNQEITGPVLNSVLQAMVSALGEGDDKIKKQINAKLISNGVINVDTVSKKVTIPGVSRLTTYKGVINLSDTPYELDFSSYGNSMIAVFYDTVNNEFGLKPYGGSFSDEEIICLYVNIVTGLIYGDGLKDSNYTINNEYVNKANFVKNSELDKYISLDWNLSDASFIFETKLVASANIPDDNSKLSFYNKIDRVWWIEADVMNHYNGITPLSGGHLSIALVLSERSDNDFRMLKLNVLSNGSKELVYYTRNNNAWRDSKTIISPVVGTVDNTVPYSNNIKMSICGKGLQIYENNKLLGYALSNEISSDSKLNMKAGILHNAPNNAAKNIKFGIRPVPYAHFSVDDVGNSLKRVTQNVDIYSSIFDDPFYGFWKEVHDLYGVVVTMNIFYSIGTGDDYWDLTSMTNKFKVELNENSSWLKFAFHGGDETIKYNDEANNAAGLISFNNTIIQIIRFSSLANVDKFPRLSFFSGNKNFLNSLKATKNFIGCMTADDTRADNCGLTELERDCINNASADYIDFVNQLYYIKSSKRLDSMNSDTAKALVLSELNDPTRSMVMEYFFHETISSTVFGAARAAIQTLNERGMRFDFPQNNMPF